MFIHIQHRHLFLSDGHQMDTSEKLEHPAGGRRANPLSLLLGEGLVVLLQGLPDAVLQGGLDQ